jgi:type IV secretion system protein VirB8
MSLGSGRNDSPDGVSGNPDFDRDGSGYMMDDDIEGGDESWTRSVTWELERSRRIAWIVAAVASVIALLLAIALVILLPLKTVEPYTILVDRQTGNVERLSPIDQQVVTPDAALTRSMLAQYVIARESFDGASIQQDFRKVGLWSANDARQRYSALMQASNPQSPLAFMPRGGRIQAEILSVSSLKPGQSMVRFATTRTDPGAREQERQYWASIIDYQFSGAAMSEDDRLLNPLGFQVTRYRRDAETMPELEQAPAAQASPASAPARVEPSDEAQSEGAE